MAPPRKLVVGAAPSTRQTLESLWRHHLEPQLPADIYDLVDGWLERDLSVRTVQKLMTLYRGWCEETGRDAPDTRRLMRRLRRREAAPVARAWTKEQAERALAAAWHCDKELYLAIAIALHTGARPGEILALRWRDVDMLGGRILIRRTKTGRARSVPISQGLSQILEGAYIVGQSDELPLITRTSLLRPLRRLCDIAGVPRVRFHDLRHTFATLALSGGAPLRAVSSILGHQNVSITTNVYWHLLEGDSIDEQLLPNVV